MKDPVTGRLYRGPGEPEFFLMADRDVSDRIKARTQWLTRVTGYPVDARSVYIAEALRKRYFRWRQKELIKIKHTSPHIVVPQEMRTSERKTFGTCHKQWWWRYVEWLDPIRKGNALWFGTAVHEALAAWYRPGLERGPHPTETFLATIEQDRKMVVDGAEGEAEFTTATELGVAMLNGYVEHYGRDEHMEILAVEQTFGLVFKEDARPFLRYLLTMDGLYRDLRTGQVFILEHKTSRQIRPGFLVPGGPLAMDNQAGSYYAAAPYVLPLADLLKPGEKISGITYNVLRKGLPDDRPRNADGLATNKPLKVHYQAALEPHGVLVGKSMTLDTLAAKAAELGITVYGEVGKEQPAALFHREPVYRSEEEQATQLQRIQDEARWMREMRNHNPDFPVLKTPGEHCAWCPFQRMCELDEQGDADAVESFKATVMEQRDPYETYRKAA